jgi:hypothetical protein
MVLYGCDLDAFKIALYALAYGELRTGAKVNCMKDVLVMASTEGSRIV